MSVLMALNTLYGTMSMWTGVAYGVCSINYVCVHKATLYKLQHKVSSDKHSPHSYTSQNFTNVLHYSHMKLGKGVHLFE